VRKGEGEESRWGRKLRKERLGGEEKRREEENSDGKRRRTRKK